MRHVRRLGERRHCDHRYSHSKLVECGATGGEWPGWILRQSRAKRFSIQQRRIGRTDKIPRTLRAASRLLAEWWQRQIFALSGEDAIRRTSAVLRSTWWPGVVVESAMLVVQNKYDGILPEWPVAHGVHDIGNMILPALNICRRMLVVFQRSARSSQIRVHK